MRNPGFRVCPVPEGSGSGSASLRLGCLASRSLYCCLCCFCFLQQTPLLRTRAWEWVRIAARRRFSLWKEQPKWKYITQMEICNKSLQDGRNEIKSGGDRLAGSSEHLCCLQISSQQWPHCVLQTKSDKWATDVDSVVPPVATF